jgi:hypothetical protein
MPPRRRKEEDDEPKETSKWLYIGFLVLICGSGLPVILPVIDVVFDWIGSSGYTQFSPNDESLPPVFFGGSPWVIFCRNGNAELPGLWTATAKKHVQSEDAGLFSFAVLDCSAPFAKSGKNTYERFKLKAPEHPHAIFCANGAPPLLMPWDWNIADPKQPEIQAILTQLKTKTRPISRVVSTTASLSDYCTSHKRCALILHNSTLDEASKNVLDSLMQSYRLVKWVRVDVSTRYISLEKSLPPIPDAPPKEPRVIFFKRDPDAKTKALAARAHKGLFSVAEITEFLEGCLNPEEGSVMAPLKHPPYITKRTANNANKSKTGTKKPTDPKHKQRSKQDEARKEQKENNERRQRERDIEEEVPETEEVDELGEETIDLDEGHEE